MLLLQEESQRAAHAAMARSAAESRLVALSCELENAQTATSAILEQHRSLAREADEAKDDMQDLYYYLQQKLDNNYVTITSLERRVINARVELESEGERHATRTEAMAAEMDGLLAEARDAAGEAREALARTQRDCAVEHKQDDWDFPRGDERDRICAERKREELEEALDAARKELTREREQLRRERICHKEQLHLDLARDAERRIDLAIRGVFGAVDGSRGIATTIGDRVLAAHMNDAEALSVSGKRLMALDAEFSRLSGVERALERECALARETHEAAKAVRSPSKPKEDVIVAVSAPRKLDDDRSLRAAERAAAKATRERVRAYRSASSFVATSSAVVDCILVLLRRAVDLAKLDEFDDIAAGSCSTRDRLLHRGNVIQGSWPSDFETSLEPRTKIIFIKRLAQVAHTYRASLHQLLPAAPVVHALSETALVRATDHAHGAGLPLPPPSPLQCSSSLLDDACSEDTVSAITATNSRSSTRRSAGIGGGWGARASW